MITNIIPTMLVIIIGTCAITGIMVYGLLKGYYYEEEGFPECQ